MARHPNWTNGHIKFRTEAAKHESRRKFYRTVGVDVAQGSLIYRGLSMPGVDKAAGIEAGTKGKIKIRDWAIAAEAPPDREAAA